MSKKIFLFLNLIFFLCNLNAAYAGIFDGFLLRTSLSAELQASQIKAKALNGKFESKPFEDQIKNLDNVALGLNFRVHKYLGFNANLSKFSAQSNFQDGVLLQNKSDFSFQNANLSALVYIPLIGDNLVDMFIEGGVSDVNFELKYKDALNDVYVFKDHETALFYGGGIEISPYNWQMAFRLSAQRYITKLDPIKGDVVTWRGGFIKYF
jgi:hypothetical protein